MEKEFQDLFQIRHNDDRVEVGKVLIAEPFLEGKYLTVPWSTWWNMIRAERGFCIE